jgi:hypothetical protein
MSVPADKLDECLFLAPPEDGRRDLVETTEAGGVEAVDAVDDGAVSIDQDRWPLACDDCEGRDMLGVDGGRAEAWCSPQLADRYTKRDRVLHHAWGTCCVS